MGRSNVFSLEQIYRKQITQTWSKIPEVFRYVNSLASGPSPAGTDFGYFMGGSAECCPYLPPFSTVDRLDFSNDTDNMVAKAALTTAKAYMKGFSSLTHGYTAGGYAPAVTARVTTIDRIDYASDTTAQTAKGPLGTPVSSNNVGLHNTEYGYTLGGSSSPSITFISLNQRLEFANDTTTASPKGNLSQNKNYGAGAGNQSYGYYSGGGTPSRISSVERLDYSSDTTTLAPKGPLSRVVNEHDAAGNADYGYHAGGWDPSSPYSNVTDRIDYASDTATALVKAILAYPGKHGPTTTGNTSYGYWTGGYGNTTASHRLDYSSDTTQMSIKGKRTTFSQNGAGVSSRANAMPLTSSTDIVPATRTEAGTPTPVGTDYGYFAGGATPSKVSSIDRLDYNNDTPTMVVKGSLTQTNEAFEGVSNISYGYFAGGNGPGSYSPRTSVDRIDYGNDTATASPKGPLAAGLAYGGGVGNNSYGYLSNGITASGYPPLMTTTVNRIDYSSDTSTALAKGPRSFEIMNSQGCGTQSYGYFGGGSSKSTVDRVDYSNDTATMAPKGPLDIAGSTFAAASNSSYGWWMGRFPNQPTVSRLDFSSDTTTASPRGSMNTGKSLAAGTGNASYGYSAGGTPGSPKTQVDRVDYSNDTGTASLKGPLSIGRYRFSAASSRADVNPTSTPSTVTVDKGADGYTTSSSGPAMGYVLGGAFPYSFSIVDRMDYSNDTATMAVKGPLSAGTSYQAAVSSKDHGYSMGGKTPSNGKSSKVDRVDYANDTATAAVKGPLSAGVYRSYAGVGNKDYGYHSGGNRPGTSSTIDRIEYASDTSTATPKGNLASARYLHSGAGNLSYGYQIGGSPPFQNNSVVQRIDYGNDTATAVTKGNLNQGSRKATSTGNASYGYVGGGTNPNLSQITRIDYSNDTATSVAKGPLTVDRASLSSFSAPGHGYFAGGNYTMLSSVDRMDYSNDTATAVAKGPLSSARGYNSGVSSRDIGGSLSGTPTFIPRIRWVDSVAEVPISSLAPSFGYFQNGSNNKTVVERLDFDNDTETLVAKGNLSEGRKDLATVGNTSYGYFAAGYVYPDPSPGSRHRSTVDRLDYSNDTTNAVAKGPVRSRYNVGGTGNASYGYVVGGDDGSGISRTWVDRIDYGNDTATASPKGDLNISPGGRKKQGCVGNMSFGYFTGGTNGSQYFTHINRIDYSNDTATAPTKGNLSIARDSLKSTGNASFGYCIGGYAPSLSSPITTVDRIDYSNDTAVASVRGSLTETVTNHGATGSPSFGYAGAGGGDLGTRIDRISYSNDTATAVTKSTTPSPGPNREAVGPRINGLPPTDSLLAPVQPPFPFPVQLPLPLITENLTLHLDAGDSNSYSGSGNTWTDLSGEGHNGTIYGATYNTGNGGYFDFDGTNDYISISDTDVIPSGTNSFTYSVWIYIDNISSAFGSNVAASLFSGDLNNRVECGLFRPSGTGTGAPTLLKLTKHGGGNTGSCSVDISMNLSQWYNVTVIRDGVSSQVVYINGVSVGTGDLSNSFVSGSMKIGGAANSTGYHGWLNGRIGIVLMYNTALSSSQVLRNYNAIKSRYGY